ncbi:MAG: hypothetical protein K0Q50_365 [Vampirovibrio sp.]|jgi:hypothetical protein|nr:hypothetical protein [Vampirovibrio sp.]
MKKSIPFVACALMLAMTPAFAVDASMPVTGADPQAQTQAAEPDKTTTTETRTEALQTQSTPTTDSVKSTVKESTEVEAKSSPVVEGQAQTESSAAATTSTDDKDAAVTGATQTTTTTETEAKTTAPNVQKLFGLFQPNKQAEATPGTEAQKQDTPASTQNTQTAQ